MIVLLFQHTEPTTTDQNGEQEGEELECGADVVEVGLVVLDGGQQLVEPGQLELRVRPEVRPQHDLQQRHASP